MKRAAIENKHKRAAAAKEKEKKETEKDKMQAALDEIEDLEDYADDE